MRRALTALVAVEAFLLGVALVWLAVECAHLAGWGQWLFAPCLLAAFVAWWYFGDVLEGRR